MFGWSCRGQMMVVNPHPPAKKGDLSGRGLNGREVGPTGEEGPLPWRIQIVSALQQNNVKLVDDTHHSRKREKWRKIGEASDGHLLTLKQTRTNTVEGTQEHARLT